jgi:hypothetical protein
MISTKPDKARAKNTDAAYTKYVRRDFLQATQYGDVVIIFMELGGER